MHPLLKNIKRINWYPPYLGSGIRLKSVNENITQIVVEMRLRWYNQNAVGTHFGGSLYSMCDPHYMFIAMANLGKNYIVWDKAASIDFKKATKEPVTATFELSAEQITEMKTKVDAEGKGLFTYSTNVVTEKGEIVATVEKVIYVRKK